MNLKLTKYTRYHTLTYIFRLYLQQTSKRKGFDVKTQQSFKRSDYAESVAEEVFWYASPNGHFAGKDKLYDPQQFTSATQTLQCFS